MKKTITAKVLLPFFFGAAKLILHFATNTNYGLHRDEFLYFDLGKKLSWGYYEIPCITPFIGHLADLLGGSVFAIRLFPALAGTVIIILACKLVKDIGGGTWAMIITGMSLLLTPSLLGSNSLFQPVSFNQLFWFLIAFSIVQIITKKQNRTYYTIGVLIGLGFLTKYSIAFYLVALLAGLLLTKERSLLRSKRLIATISIATFIAIPNLLWQVSHGFPLLSHMEELSRTQLVHMNWGLFLKSQFIQHKGFTVIWILGLVGVFSIDSLKKYKSIGIGFLLTLLLIGLLHGKSYYTLGAFLILFPFGGIAIEHFIKSSLVKSLLLLIILIITLPFYPLSMPLLKIEGLKKYCHYISEEYGIRYMLRWEDGNYYELPQDFADMHGWEQLARKVAKLYHALPDNIKEKCMLYGGSYGHAASLNYYKDKYQLPETISFNGSYLFRAPETAVFDNQILVDDRKQGSSSWFNSMVLVDSIQGVNAREKGYIYYRTQPKLDLKEEWTRVINEERGD